MRIEDILESIERIETYTAGLDFPAWSRQQLVIDAVIRNLEIIGEAANHVPATIQSSFPAVPWAQMRGIRNVVAHEYFGIDDEVIWKTVREDLPRLKTLLQEVLGRY